MRLILFILAGITFTIGSGHLARAQDTQFQKNSETAVEETIEQKDGKTVRKIRQGQVKQRKGEAQVGEIEDDEVHAIERRKKALRLTSLGFGPFGSSKVGDDKILYGFNYGKHWETNTTGEITLDLVSVINGKGSLWNFGLGYAWLPLRGDISPVIGGALGMGYADRNEGAGGGFSGQLTAGARLFRLADVQMEILGTYIVIMDTGSPYVAGAQLRVLY